MTITRKLLVAWAIVALSSVSAEAVEPWSLSKLNPFAAKSAKPKLRKTSKTSTSSSWFSMPKAPDLITPIKKANQRTKKFFVKTAEYLSPSKFLAGSVKKTSYRKKLDPSSSARGWPKLTSKKKESKSFFSSLFSLREVPQPARTMTEFVGRKRPKFGGTP